MPRQVDYYFSLQSPWAYIGHKLFREVASTYGLKVNHKPVVLVDLFSETGGRPLEKRPPVRAAHPTDDVGARKAYQRHSRRCSAETASPRTAFPRINPGQSKY